jgi:hypothetical protein
MAGAGQFLCIEGSDTQGIVLSGNNLSRGDEATSLAQDVRPDALVE